MRFLILMGSPRPDGNTAELLKPFVAELKALDQEVAYIPLAGKEIAPCLGCGCCQDVPDVYGCVQRDDMQSIVDEVLRCDVLVLAAPIYSWYCPAPMKAVLDRHYGLNKYYGAASGSLWRHVRVALLTTHGYPREDATGPFVQGITRLCEHSRIPYLGMYSARDIDGIADFQTPAVVEGARQFARRLVTQAAG